MKTSTLIFTIFVVLTTLSAAYANIVGAATAAVVELAKINCRKDCISQHNNDHSYSESYIDRGLDCHCYSRQAETRNCRQTCIDKYGNSAYFASYVDNGSCLCHSDQHSLDQCRDTCVGKYNDEAYRASYMDTNGSCLCQRG